MRTRLRPIGVCGAVGVLLVTAVSGAGPRFLADDPVAREPERQSAAGATIRTIDPTVDLVVNLLAHPGDPDSNALAHNVNTIDEVPDSSWFTNRIVARPMTAQEIGRGPGAGTGPAAGTWTVLSPTSPGGAPGFIVRDTGNRQWSLAFDVKGYPEAATGAVAVASRILWAIGYWQEETHIVTVARDRLMLEPSSSITPPSGKARRMRQDDVDQILRQAHRGPDGSYRAVAVMTPPGRAVGTFRYYGTRQDDPNDVVPHEHRRELRALKVFGAWINLIDLDARHTLDTVITEGDRATIRHYLLIGSALGASAGGPVDFDAGWESLYQRPLARRRLLRLGFVFRPWQTVPYEEHPGLGRFEGHVFDPLTWRPRAPTAAFLSARADDTFWAARRVAAFTREMIEAAAAAGRYSSPEARKLLSDILIVRQGRITAAYLPAVNPLVDFALSADGRLAFRNAAVDATVVPAPPGGYQAAWATFDNATGQAVSIGTTTGPQGGAAPAALPATPGTFVRVEISAVGAAPPAWTMPVGAYFRRNASGWSLVGVERIR